MPKKWCTICCPCGAGYRRSRRACVKKLEGAIAAGHLEPGSRLAEREIAQRFGVSRTPVREAFRLMAANNLVELRGRQGATVRAIKAQALIEMFQVMAELEGLCARLAARRVSQAWGDEIAEIHQRLMAAGETGGIDGLFYDINQEFHEAIYEASRNTPSWPTRPASCAIRWRPIGAG